MLTPAQIAAIAAKALDDKKARDVKVLKTTEQTVLADYFVICNGSSSTHIKALVDEVDKQLPEAGELLYHGSGAAPVYLIANESDIMPNTQVTVTAADGTAIIYQPFLSLRDGSLSVPEDGTVYDFTVYPEGFVRETTA